MLPPVPSRLGLLLLLLLCPAHVGGLWWCEFLADNLWTASGSSLLRWNEGLWVVPWSWILPASAGRPGGWQDGRLSCARQSRKWWQRLPGAQGWGSENVSSSSVSDAGTVPVTARPLGASCSRTFERQPSCLLLLQPAPATRSRRPVPWESSCSVVARHPVGEHHLGPLVFWAPLDLQDQQVPQKPVQPGSGEAVEMMWTSGMRSQDSLWMHSTSGDVATSVHWCNCTTMRQAGWRCGATRAPSASATGCRVRALCAPAGRSCLRSARWAQGCWNASTEPLASWAPTTAKPCCPQSARSSLQAEPTSSTLPTRPTSVPPIGAPARRARAAAPATAVPRTSAAATCCAAVADTARRAYSSRRTACAASTGAAWCSATAAACARSSACASDPPPASQMRAALLAICGTTGFQQAALSEPSCSLGKIHI
ncbi:protein Wnt-6 isoform X1 [Microtus pennsylvanicus]|uniref:protein Wnt-6 isoform X1 n=1 Tax=Microtus pennsylvanicus TaxID=10058 RepID=UPI003F6D92DB